jgi:threonine synthase
MADAIEAGADAPMAVEHPDTVVGPLEIPDPAGGDAALAAIRESDGTAVALSDDDILGGAQTLAEAGLPASVTGGAALAAARSLTERGDLDVSSEVVLVNPVSGSKEADLMRSHLMRQGR